MSTANGDRVVVRLETALRNREPWGLLLALDEPYHATTCPPHVVAYDHADPALSAVCDEPPSPGAIGAAGDFLFRLLGQNQHAADALGHALRADEGRRVPVFVYDRSHGWGERLPWETLRTPEGVFLSLAAQWPVNRMVDAAVTGARPRALDSGDPLRIAAVLSCLGVSALQEWNALKEAVGTEGKAIDLDLLVLTGERDLRDVIRADGPPGSGVKVSVGSIPLHQEDLVGVVEEFEPHILHFFCHGSVDQGPHIELATTSDWDGWGTRSSLHLEAANIIELTPVDGRPWLTVLNCCSGAAPGQGYGPLARKLVTDGGFPAVIGRREPIAVEEAQELTRSLYRELFVSLRERGLGGIRPEDVDWFEPLRRTRRLLLRPHSVARTPSNAAATSKEWSRPVLYLPHGTLYGGAANGHPRSDEPMADDRRMELDVLLGLLRAPYRPPERFLRAVEAQVEDLLPGRVSDEWGDEPDKRGRGRASSPGGARAGGAEGPETGGSGPGSEDRERSRGTGSGRPSGRQRPERLPDGDWAPGESVVWMLHGPEEETPDDPGQT
ncbi:CHAT domain-containing protein [Streptomyces sp. NPDC003077]|uniref:CHAT domain-containing protein n=1 Tax=Streptomyces sp. NPDC003077 TaxID=3154443 RepID=UPI0033B720E9